MLGFPDFCLNFDSIPLNDPSQDTTVGLSDEGYQLITTLVDRGNAGDIFVGALAANVKPAPLKANQRTRTFDSRRYSLVATYAVPGGGRSFLLDQLAACKGRLPGSSTLPEMDELLKNAIFVNISYNGIQQGGPNTTAVQGLAIRLLHS